MLDARSYTFYVQAYYLNNPMIPPVEATMILNVVDPCLTTIIQSIGIINDETVSKWSVSPKEVWVPFFDDTFSI